MQSREEPLQLKLDTCKSVFFKPTWVGCSSTSLFTFRNPSRLPLEFEWRVSQQHRKMLAVQPARGIIQPNESLVSALPRAGGKDTHHPHLPIISYSRLSGARLTPPSKPQSFFSALCIGMTVTIIFTPVLQRRIETCVGGKPFTKTVN